MIALPAEQVKNMQAFLNLLLLYSMYPFQSYLADGFVFRDERLLPQPLPLQLGHAPHFRRLHLLDGSLQRERKWHTRACNTHTLVNENEQAKNTIPSKNLPPQRNFAFQVLLFILQVSPKNSWNSLSKFYGGEEHSW